ncbi:hypothetical protein Esti_004287 [Eimeria stiedai]
MSGQVGAVGLLGVARVQPKRVLATFAPRISSKQQTEFSQGFEVALGVVKPVGSARFKAERSGLSFLFLVDPAAQLVYGAVVRDPNYPDRIAYQLLSQNKRRGSPPSCVQAFHAREFQKSLSLKCGEQQLKSISGSVLERSFRKEARGLLSKYSSALAADPTSQMLQKVESVKVVVDANIKKVLENQGNLLDLGSRADSLAGASRQFKKEAQEVNYETWKQKAGLTIVIVVLLAAIVGYMVFVVVQLAT